MSTENSPTTAGAGSTSGGTVGPVSYRAQQVPGAVVIFAEGFNPTPGYTNYFEQSPIEIYPPQFILRSVPPGGITTQVLTPFAIWVMFGASSPIKLVTVVDGDGDHKIKVEQTPDLKAPASTETWVQGHVMARARLEDRPTTMATGEESGGGPTTMATGEEDVTAPTTLVTGEEGGGGPIPMAMAAAQSQFTTLAVGEEGASTHVFGEEDPTTLMVGEEGGSTLRFGEEGPTTYYHGEENPTTFRTGEEDPTTWRLGEEGPTTLAVGEEEPTTYRTGEEGPTTLAYGEEDPTTFRVGEEGPPNTTLRLGEEGPTTLAVGEEGYGGGGGYGGGNPFGNF